MQHGKKIVGPKPKFFPRRGGAKENASFVRNDSGVVADLNSRANHLQLQFTVEDEGAFTTPWSATVIYRPGLGVAFPGEWPEAVCAENPHQLSRQAALPTADTIRISRSETNEHGGR